MWRVSDPTQNCSRPSGPRHSERLMPCHLPDRYTAPHREVGEAFTDGRDAGVMKQEKKQKDAERRTITFASQAHALFGRAMHAGNAVALSDGCDCA